ncbi:MAG: hypothetical protein HYX56_05965 [Chloroflexi bacterium]|nr:hypothetical protein [Chloroflexota bacterium]
MLEHVKWFTDPKPFPTQYELLWTWPVLLAFGCAFAAVGIAFWVQHNIPEPTVMHWFERFAGLGPTVLGWHIGIALIWAAAIGRLFVPSLMVDTNDAYGTAILVLEAVAGVSILLGLATRAGAAILVVLGVLAMEPFSFEAILEQVHVLGIAIFLFLIGRGPLSLDRIRKVRPPVTSELVPMAALASLRILMGFGIAYTALTEKLLDPPLSQSLLERYPSIALNRLVGAPDAAFIWAAGTVELAIGIVIISGQLTRPAMAVGAALFTVSLFAFGWLELLGHLPFLGIMLLLFIAPNADPRSVRKALRPAA